MAKITLSEESADPTTPTAGNWRLYFKSGGLYVIDDAGTVIGPIATIGDNSLALAKLVNATARYNLIGRSSAGAGAWEEKATSADVFALLGAADIATFRTSAGLGTGDSPQFTGVEVGHASDTTLTRSAAGVLAVEGVVIPSISSTNTLTNKRITKRSVTVTVAAEPAINTDNGDVFRIGTSGDLIDLAITSLTTNLTGTPTHGQMICLEFLDDGTARAISHGASFRAGTNFALLTTTVLSKLSRELFQWDSADSKWDCVGVWTEA